MTRLDVPAAPQTDAETSLAIIINLVARLIATKPVVLAGLTLVPMAAAAPENAARLVLSLNRSLHRRLAPILHINLVTMDVLLIALAARLAKLVILHPLPAKVEVIVRQARRLVMTPAPAKDIILQNLPV